MTALARPGVTGVPMAVVVHLDLGRIERLAQRVFERLGRGPRCGPGIGGRQGVGRVGHREAGSSKATETDGLKSIAAELMQ